MAIRISHTARQQRAFTPLHPLLLNGLIIARSRKPFALPVCLETIHQDLGYHRSTNFIPHARRPRRKQLERVSW